MVADLREITARQTSFYGSSPERFRARTLLIFDAACHASLRFVTAAEHRHTAVSSTTRRLSHWCTHPVVAAFCRTVFRSKRFDALDLLAALIVAHLWRDRAALKQTSGVDVTLSAGKTPLYHVGATLCAGGHEGQVRRVVIHRVHGCLVACDSISGRVEGLLGRHREFPAARAEEPPAGLIPAEGPQSRETLSPLYQLSSSETLPNFQRALHQLQFSANSCTVR